MFTRYRTEGIFLKKSKRFEADEYLIFYSKDFGKIGVTGKSIRKIKSKLRSSAELFCYSDIEFVRGKHYNILTAAEIINSFSDLKKDLGKLSLAYRLSSLIESFLTEEEKDEKLWALIKKSFTLLNEFDFNQTENKKEKLLSFYYYFSFKFLSVLGYKPELDGCLIDKKEPAFNFSPREGGLICDQCAKNIKDPLKIKIEEEDKNFLEKVEKENFEEFLGSNFHFSPKMETLFKNYIATLPSKTS